MWRQARRAILPPSTAPLEEQRTERRQAYAQRVRIPVHDMRERVVTRNPRESRTAEARVIRIEDDFVAAGIGHAEPVVLARHRRRVEHAQDGRVPMLLAQERKHALVGAVQVAPAEASGVAVAGMELRERTIQARELAVQILEALVF